MDHRAFRIGVTGGADDKVRAMFQGGFYDLGSEGMHGEINDAGCLRGGGIEILAHIVGGGDGDKGFRSGGLQQGLAHAAGFSCDE